MHHLRPTDVDDDRRWVLLALVAAVAPVVYFVYAVAVEWVRHGRTLLEPPLSGGMVLASVGLAAVGALALVAWRRGYPATLLATVGCPLAWPWLYTSVPAGGSHVLIPCVAVAVVGGTEVLVRTRGRVDVPVGGRTTSAALGAGVAHFAFGFALQAATRPYWLDMAQHSGFLVLVVLFVSGLALVGLGALPVVLWDRYRLVAPAAVVVGWVLAALAWVARHHDHLVLSEFTGVHWAKPRPGPDYMTTWVVPLAALAVAALAEVTLRRLLGSRGVVRTRG